KIDHDVVPVLANAGEVRTQSVAGNPDSVDPGSAGSSAAADVDDVDVERHLAALALDFELDLLADTDALQLLGEIRQPAPRLAVHSDNHVAERSAVGVDAAQPGALGRRARDGAHDHDAFDAGPRRRVLVRGDDADPGRRHVAFADDLGHHAVDDV